MKRLKALSISFILSLFISLFFLKFYGNKINKDFNSSVVKNNSIKYSTLYSKYNSHDILTNNIDSNTILLMGSSELSASIESEEHPKQFLDFCDKNIMQIGGGNFQSLIHSIILGSISKDVDLKTVNIILSMQWFTKEGMNKEAFLSRLSIDHLNNLYRNEKISEKLKKRIYNRVLELSKDSKFNNNYVGRLNRDNLIDKMVNYLQYKKYKLLQNSKFYREYILDNSINTKKFPDNINWENYKNMAIERAKKETSNNNFYIENNYFDTYIRKDFEKFKNSSKDASFSESPEYDDLQLFLCVAKELDIKVNMFLIPLQGYWADYTGISHKEINKFYDKIIKISKDNDVNLIDYSKYSYEPYFFKDIMHLGRLGFLKLQKDLLNNN